MYSHLLRAGLVFSALVVIISLASSAQLQVNGSEPHGSDPYFNGTTYILFEHEMKVILPVNGIRANLTLFDEAEDMALLDESGSNVSFNSSYQFHRGDHIYSLVFERPVRGTLVYNISRQGQQFILPIRHTEPVRIILPPGYSTGSRSLGIARPEPDIFQDADSGSILTWNNTTQIPYIEVNYYRKSAPYALMIIMAILAGAGLVLLIRYYMSIKKLKAARMELEKE
ncbi:MAG: DUF5803 family protein [Methanothrix sp.]|nr:DUF5803 family protein [Methanothrix sp.]